MKQTVNLMMMMMMVLPLGLFHTSSFSRDLHAERERERAAMLEGRGFRNVYHEVLILIGVVNKWYILFWVNSMANSIPENITCLLDLEVMIHQVVDQVKDLNYGIWGIKDHVSERNESPFCHDKRT